ncbi:hypothetical protein Tco_0902612 [Tanacetum coccineum]
MARSPPTLLVIKRISENLDDTLAPDTAGNSMAHINATFVDLASLEERNRNPSSPKHVHFINSIFILSKECEAKEEGNVKPNAAEYKDHKRAVEVKEEIEKESKEEFAEETKEETEEEEEDELEYFDTFPTIDELRYHEWIQKNPRPL